MKVRYKKQIHKVAKCQEFDQLVTLSKKAFKMADFENQMFWYLDQDNDVLCIQNQEELDDYLQSEPGPLKLAIASNYDEGRIELESNNYAVRNATSVNSGNLAQSAYVNIPSQKNTDRNNVWLEGLESMVSESQQSSGFVVLDQDQYSDNQSNVLIDKMISEQLSAKDAQTVLGDLMSQDDLMKRVEQEMNKVGVLPSISRENNAEDSDSSTSSGDLVECYKCKGTTLNKKGEKCKKCNGTGQINNKYFKDFKKILSSQVNKYCNKEYDKLKTSILESQNIKLSQQQKSDDSVKEVHWNVACDGCAKYIVGIRYKCTVRENYDLCQECEQKMEHPHPLIKIKKALYNPFNSGILKEKNLPEVKAEIEQIFSNSKDGEDTDGSSIKPVRVAQTNKTVQWMLETKVYSIDAAIQASAKCIRKPDTRELFDSGQMASLSFKFKNDGREMWPTDIKLVKTKGSPLLNIEPTLITDLCLPGDEIDVVVHFVAPNKAGQFSCFMSLVYGPDEEPFGEKLWFYINVQESQEDPKKPEHVSPNMEKKKVEEMTQEELLRDNQLVRKMDDGKELTSDSDQEVEIIPEAEEGKITESYLDYQALEVTESQIKPAPEQVQDENEDSDEEDQEFQQSRKEGRNKNAKKVVKSNIQPVPREPPKDDDSDEEEPMWTDSDYRPVLDSWQNTLKQVEKKEIQKKKDDIITHFIELDSGLEANKKARYVQMLEGAKQRNMEPLTAEQMGQLLDLGFYDYEKNTFLLRMCENDMNLVIEKLSVK